MVGFFLLVAVWALALIGVILAVWRTGWAQYRRHGQLPDSFPLGVALLAVAFVYTGGILFGVWVGWFQ